MLKKVLFAVVPVLLVASSAIADDFLGEVASLKADSIQDAAIAIENVNLDGLDVDALADNAGGKSSDEAIEACFRRFGWGGYGGYGCYNYNYSYNYCYRPCYTYYQPFYCYRPVTYYSCYPVYTNYWGCY